MVSWGAEDLEMTQSPARRAELGFAWWLCGHSGSYLQLCLGDWLACSRHLSLKNLTLGFQWQLLLFPALEVSRSAGLVVLLFFFCCYVSVIGAPTYGSEFSHLWPILTAARLAMLLAMSLLCISLVGICYWWTSTPEDVWCSFALTSVAGGGAGSYSCVSNSAPLLLSSPPTPGFSGSW